MDVGGPTAGVIQASRSTFVSFSMFFFIFQVVDQVKKIQGAPDTAHQKKGSQYNEAWEAIRSHIIKRRPEDIRVEKVKAHQDPERIEDPHQRWCAKGNETADMNAKRAITEDAADIYQERQKAAESQTKRLQELIKYHQYLVEAQTEVL